MQHTAGYANDSYDNKLMFMTGVDDKNEYVKVISCGHNIYSTNSSHVVRPEGRLDYQIIYVVNGRVSFKFGNRTIWLGKGNVALYKPCEENDYHHQYDSEVYWVHFTGCGVEMLLREAGMYDDSHFNAGYDDEVIRIFDRIIREMQVKRTFYQHIVSSHFILLLFTLARGINKNGALDRSVLNGDLSRVIERMHRDYHLNIPLETYARECNLSVNWFINVFKRHTGMSPMKYINSIRINKAKYLLANTSMSVHEISSITNYENIHYFSRAFKKSTGMPPSQFRETCGNIK